MSISEDFDNEGTDTQTSVWLVWYLTPRMFEKEARERHAEQVREESEQHIHRLHSRGLPILRRTRPLPKNPTEETVLANWDQDLYHSKLLWPITCMFGISFPALHLISWDGSFPTVFELWLWRAAAITSTVTMLIFMHFEKVVVRWKHPWTLWKVIPPGLYLLSRIVMLAEAFAALRASNPAIYETFVVANYWLHLA